MQNRKGLSDIVSTVLIILLVVAAIAIIGAIVLNVVNNAGTKINSAVDCQGVAITPTSCKSGGNGTYVISAIGTGISVSKVNAYTYDAGGLSVGTPITDNTNIVNKAGVISNISANATTLKLAVEISGASSGVCPISAQISCN
ncbi:MAG: hypothetical protein WCK29_00220 [archaeon]